MNMKINMNKQHYCRLLCMSLLVLLPSSSFFWPTYLNKQLATKQITPNELKVALTLKLPQAFQYQLNQYKPYRAKWLIYAAHMAYHDSSLAMQLGEYYRQKNNIPQATFWFQQSLKQGYYPAVIELAKQQIGSSEIKEIAYLKVKVELKPYLNQQAVLQFSIELAIRYGDLSFVKSHLSRLINTSEADSLVSEIAYYQVLTFLTPSDEALLASNPRQHPTCSNAVQLLATSLAHLRQAEQLIESFQTHVLSPYVCFNTPRYIPMSLLNCDLTADKAINCNDALWQAYQHLFEARYLAVMLPLGGANVYKGVLYFDVADNKDVFAHEISHLLGFIDEYPLQKTHVVCQKDNLISGHNFMLLPTYYKGNRASIRQRILKKLPWGAFVQAATPILTRYKAGWLLGTPDSFQHSVGLFKANTCHHAATQAFKPIKKATALEFFDAEFPELYERILASAPNKYLMPSYKNNVNLVE